MPRRRGSGGPRARATVAVTIQIMFEAPDHDLTDDPEDPGKPARRYATGDIVDTIRTDRFATNDGQQWRWNTPILNPRLVFIHMAGVDSDRVPSMRRRFQEKLTVNNLGDIEDSGQPMSRRTRWRVHWHRLPQGHIDNLTNNRETTIPWSTIKPYIRQKVYTVIEDPSQDNEDTSLTDEEIPPVSEIVP